MFKKQNDGTYELIIPLLESNQVNIVAFNNDKPKLLTQAFIEIDEADGSRYDSDGDEKNILMSLNGNIVILTTEAQDYDFWKNTEKSTKKGNLGYVEDLFLELFNSNNFQQLGAYPTDQGEGLTLEEKFDEGFVCPRSYVIENYPYLLNTNKSSKPAGGILK